MFLLNQVEKALQMRGHPTVFVGSYNNCNFLWRGICMNQGQMIFLNFPMDCISGKKRHAAAVLQNIHNAAGAFQTDICVNFQTSLVEQLH